MKIKTPHFVGKGLGVKPGKYAAEKCPVCVKNPHAVALGRLGGLANAGIPKPKSAENGKKGGRPRKIK